MHELFLVALVGNDDVQSLLMVLRGLCAMIPKRQLEYRLSFEGSRTHPIVPLAIAQFRNQKPENAHKWRDLSGALQKQSHYITATYEVEPTELRASQPSASADQVRHEGNSVDFDERAGSLEFLNFPDPPGMRQVNSRLVIDIRDELSLMSLLQSINYRFSRDYVREAWYSYKDNITFRLSRDLLRSDSSSTTGQGNSEKEAPRALPIWQDLVTFDPEDKWVMSISVYVLDGNQPLLMQRAVDQITQVRRDLEGLCDFVMIPRQKLDTRISTVMPR